MSYTLHPLWRYILSLDTPQAVLRSAQSHVFLLYSAIDTIHHPLIETEEIMDLTAFTTLWRLLELGDIMILSFIVILKCHDNQNQREIFNIVILSI